MNPISARARPQTIHRPARGRTRSEVGRRASHARASHANVRRGLAGPENGISGSRHGAPDGWDLARAATRWMAPKIPCQGTEPLHARRRPVRVASSPGTTARPHAPCTVPSSVPSGAEWSQRTNGAFDHFRGFCPGQVVRSPRVPPTLQSSPSIPSSAARAVSISCIARPVARRAASSSRRDARLR